jgi:hypothetical protein
MLKERSIAFRSGKFLRNGKRKMNAPFSLSRAGQMTEQEYDKERARLRELYGDSSESAAKRDQALATLFCRSGWTEEQLANKEGRTHQWASNLMFFGQFLNFANSLAEPECLPKNLSAKKFLDIWQQQTVQTECNERIRFQQVLKIMRSESITTTRRPSIGKLIKDASLTAGGTRSTQSLKQFELTRNTSWPR